MMTHMCRRCLEHYGWGDKAPAFRIFGESCHCCQAQVVTVFMLTGGMIDRLNKEDHNEGK